VPDPTTAVIYFVVFLFSVTVHEAAHATVALLGGDRTAYLGGQVSLNPVPHIKREPFGMIVLPILSLAISGWPFGFASAPYDPMWARHHPRRAAWMALAGPGANLTLMLAAFGCIRLGHRLGYFVAPDSIRFGEIVATEAGGMWAGVAALIGIGFSINLLLGTFNLLPVPPLDGSGAVPLLLDRPTTVKYQDFLMSHPGFAMIGIIVAWQVFGSLFAPIWSTAIDLLYPGVTYG